MALLGKNWRWPLPTPSRRQRGQALLYGLFVLVSGLAALFFLFNTGQLVREKTKLVNASDAVAYSAGVMHARLLNFDAYTNRAMIANTVAVAQLVSLSSWVQYIDKLAGFGEASLNPKFIEFAPSYFAALAVGPTAKELLVDTGALGDLASGSDLIIRHALMNAQLVANEGIGTAREQVMDEVAQANYRDEGSVSVDPIRGEELSAFVAKYSGEQRTRFAEIAMTSANRDQFVPKRSWILPGLWSDCPSATATGRIDWLNRSGGTDLIGFDEWKAMDTLSEKRWVPKSKQDVLCQGLSELPDGWGSQSAADKPSYDMAPTRYGGSVAINPGSSALAQITSSASWAYSGLPSFYELSGDALKQDAPRFRFAVRLLRNKDQTTTSEGRSVVSPGRRLNAYQAAFAGGTALVAVSASEVYFQRPDRDDSCSDGIKMGRDNCYGRATSGRAHELASLFNPYWQVHLIQSDEAIRQAQDEQGAVLP
ncbi:MAG TPA: pilus assembly protein TadG-related protein [Rhodocyclaceae bacterium]|nr:pilus assembly protein TadG-related protein [Rhodocyclaceae bacterium]